MNYIKNINLSFFLIFIVCTGLQSQGTSKEKLKIFVEGKVIDFNYMRKNTPFVDFVNNPDASEVHVIITRQNTGGGGFLFILEYNSVGFPNIPKLRLTCITLSFDTDILIKEKLVKTLHSGLSGTEEEKRQRAGSSGRLEWTYDAI